MNRMKQKDLVQLLVGLLGGLAGALATRALVRRGIEPTAAAIGVGLVSALAAAAMTGTARAAATGAAGAAAGQLSAHWFAALQRRLARNDESGTSGAPAAVPPAGANPATSSGTKVSSVERGVARLRRRRSKPTKPHAAVVSRKQAPLVTEEQSDGIRLAS